MKSLAAVKWFQNGETNGLLHWTTFVQRGGDGGAGRKEEEREREERREISISPVMNEGVLIISNDLENDQRETECSTHSYLC